MCPDNDGDDNGVATNDCEAVYARNDDGSGRCCCCSGYEELQADDLTWSCSGVLAELPPLVLPDQLPSSSDIDECSSQNGRCQHNCTNTNGSHTCSCVEGCQLASNNMSCTGTHYSCLYFSFDNDPLRDHSYIRIIIPYSFISVSITFQFPMALSEITNCLEEGHSCPPGRQCVERGGSYSCSENCSDGYRLEQSGSCTPEGDSTQYTEQQHFLMCLVSRQPGTSLALQKISISHLQIWEHHSICILVGPCLIHVRVKSCTSDGFHRDRMITL